MDILDIIDRAAFGGRVQSEGGAATPPANAPQPAGSGGPGGMDILSIIDRAASVRTFTEPSFEPTYQLSANPQPLPSTIPNMETVAPPPDAPVPPKPQPMFEGLPAFDPSKVKMRLGDRIAYFKDMGSEDYDRVLDIGERLAEFQKNAVDDAVFEKSLTKEERLALEEYKRYSSGGELSKRYMATAAGIARTIPGSHLLIPETAGERKQREEAPIQAAIGGFTGNVAGAISGGGAVAAGLKKAPVVGKMMANSPLLRVAAPRTITSGGMNAGQMVGREEFKEDFWKDVAQASGGGLISVIPEVLLPAGLAQLIGQPLVDLAYDYTMDKHVRGREINKDWWMNEIMALGVSAGFAIKDVASGDMFRIEQAKQRGEIGRALGVKNADKGKGVKGKIRGWMHGREGHKFEIVDHATLTPDVKTVGTASPDGKIKGWDKYTTRTDIDYLKHNDFKLVDAEGNFRDWDEFTGPPREAEPPKPAEATQKRAETAPEEAGGTQGRVKGENVDTGQKTSGKTESRKGGRRAGEQDMGEPQKPEFTAGKPSMDQKQVLDRDLPEWHRDYTDPSVDRTLAKDLDAHRPFVEKNAQARERAMMPPLSEGDLKRIEETPEAAREYVRRALEDKGYKDQFEHDNLFTGYGTVLDKRIPHIYDKMVNEGDAPFVKEVMDLGNMSKVNDVYGTSTDFTVPNRLIRQIVGDVYVATAIEHGAIVGRGKGDEIFTLWPGYDDIGKWLDMRMNIEKRMRAERDRLGLGELVYKKNFEKGKPGEEFEPYNGRLATGALHSTFGGVVIKPGSKLTYDQAKIKASRKAEEMKIEGLREIVKKMEEKTDISKNKPYNESREGNSHGTRHWQSLGVGRNESANPHARGDGQSSARENEKGGVVGRVRPVERSAGKELDQALPHNDLTPQPEGGTPRPSSSVPETRQPGRDSPDAAHYSLGEYSDIKSGTAYGRDGGGKYFEGREARAEMYQKGMSREEAKDRLFELREAKPDLTNDSEGITVPLNREGRDKMVSDDAVRRSVENGFTREQHFAVVSDIDNLFKSALKVYEHPDKGGDPNIKAMHRFATPLHFGEAVAYITVKESAQHGKRLYSVECIEIEKLVGIMGKARSETLTLTPSARASRKIYDDNIRKLHDAVKAGKQSRSGQVLNMAEAPQFTPKTPLAAPPINNIGDSDPKINSQSEKSSKSSSDYSKGDYADGDGTPKSDGSSRSGYVPVEMPEQVGLTKRVFGIVPGIRRHFRDQGAKGRILRSKDPNTGKTVKTKIDLHKDIFNDPRLPAKVLAHEIGHGVDDVYAFFGGDKATVDELWKLSKLWRPLGKDVTAEYIAYRRSNDELLADAMSVLFDDPDLLKREAPGFFRWFDGWLKGSETPFAQAYKEVQKLYGEGPEAVAKKREAKDLEGFRNYEAGLEKQKKAEADEEKKAGGLRRGLWKRLVDAGAPLEELMDNIKKTNEGAVIPDKKNAYLNYRARKHVKSEQTAYVMKTLETVEGVLGKLDPQTVEDLGLYLKHTRIAYGDRGELANPGGHTVETSTGQLARLKRKLGDERFKAVEEAMQKFWELRKYVTKAIRESGAFSEKFCDKVEDNEWYSTVDVLQDLSNVYGGGAIEGGSGMPVGAHKQHGTLNGNIRNPFIATLVNDINMIKFIDQNNLVRNTIDLLTQHENTLGFEALPARRLGSGEFETVNNKKYSTVFVFEDGKRVAYHVSRPVADALATDISKTFNDLKAWSKIHSYFRNVITQKFPAFWIFNIQRDFRRLHRNVEVGNVLQKFMEVLKAYPEAWRYAKDGKMSETIESMLFDRAMSPSSMYSVESLTGTEGRIYEKLADLGAEPKKVNRLIGLYSKTMRALDVLNDTMEYSTKIAGYKLLKKGAPSSREMRAHRVRTRVGTPDALAGGTWKRGLNASFMFSGIGIQGSVEDLKVMKENPKRAAELYLKYSAVPAALAWLADNGMLADAIEWAVDKTGPVGDVVDGGVDWATTGAENVVSALGKDVNLGYGLVGLAKWYEQARKKIPRFDKVYRWTVPLPMETTSGKQFYLLFPKSEMGMVAQGLTYNLISAAHSGLVEKDGEAFIDDLQEMGGDLTGLSPIGLGGLHPALKVPVAGLQYLSGQNPHDFYFNGPVIPRKDYGKGHARELAQMGKWTWNNVGGQWIMRIDDSLFDFENAGATEIATRLPFLGAPLNRLIRVSDRGLNEK